MEKKIGYFFVLIFIVSTFTVPLSFVPAYGKGTPKDSIVIACKFNDNITLDPAENSNLFGIEYVMNTYDRLMACDAEDTCKINGAAAKSWSVSESGKLFTFIIRNGISFATGNPLTADDAAFSLHRLILLNTPTAFILSKLGFNPENVKQKIRAKNKNTLIIETDRKYAPNLLLRCLSSSASSIVDKNEVLKHEENNDKGNKWLKTNYAGSGPYRLRQLKLGESIFLEKNNLYWAGNPKMEKITIRHIADPSTRLMLVNLGEVDIARDVGADQVKSPGSKSGLIIKTRPDGCFYYIGINQKNNILSNPKVRQALKYLVDYNDIAANILKDNVFVHQSFIPKAFSKITEENPFNLDIEKAKSMLEQAGYKQGFNISMDVYNDLPFTDIALALQSSFAKADIKLELNYMNRSEVIDSYLSRKHDLSLESWGAYFQSPETNAYAFAWNIDNSDNTYNKNPAWCNAWEIGDFSKKTEQLLNESDHAKKTQLYKDLQKEHQEISPFVILFQKTEVAAIKPGVKGFDFGPGSGSNYQYIFKDIFKDITKE